MDIAREIKLVNFIEQSIGRPYAWGQCDCNVFILEAMDVLFDTDLAGQIRGKYKTQTGAIRYRRRSRWGSFVGLIEEAGFVEGKKGFEQTGDLLVVSLAGAGDDLQYDMAHIYLGNKIASVFPEEGVHYGLMAMMRKKKYTVWRCRCPA